MNNSDCGLMDELLNMAESDDRAKTWPWLVSVVVIVVAVLIGALVTIVS